MKWLAGLLVATSAAFTALPAPPASSLGGCNTSGYTFGPDYSYSVSVEICGLTVSGTALYTCQGSVSVAFFPVSLGLCGGVQGTQQVPTQTPVFGGPRWRATGIGVTLDGSTPQGCADVDFYGKGIENVNIPTFYGLRRWALDVADWLLHPPLEFPDDIPPPPIGDPKIDPGEEIESVHAEVCI